MTDSLILRGRGLPETREESISREFHEWERRGRGWHVHDFTVDLEPPFRPFYFFEPEELPPLDDGRVPGFFDGLFSTDRNLALDSESTARNEAKLRRYREYLAEADEPDFCGYYHEDFVEIRLSLPGDYRIAQSVSGQFLSSLAYCSSPVGFEVVGNAESITVQFTSTEKDASQLRQQLEAHFPDLSFSGAQDEESYLTAKWINAGESMLIADFGLSENFLLPLETMRGFETDPLVPIIGGMSNLGNDEVGIFQVLFQKTKNDWPRTILDTISCFEGTEFFDHVPDFNRLARDKLSSPLFAVVIRMAAKSSDSNRSMQIVRNMSGGLAQLSRPSGNELIPLSNDAYDLRYHEQALLDRQSFRCGMLLNAAELVSLVHPPSQAVQSRKLERDRKRTKAAPAAAIGHALVLGENAHQDKTQEVSLSNDQRTRHIHLIGSSGSGKSTLLLSLIKQDLERGHGVCVIDPHGDLVDSVVSNVPDNRIDDVILFDPSDAEYPVGFNILQAQSQLEKTILSSDLVATFRRMSTSWGDVMDSVLANAILAFVESSRGGTLFDLKRFLVEKDFRKEFLKSVTDDGIIYFWENEFPLIAGKPQASILIRLDTFLRQSLIRNIVCQRDKKLDFRKIMDSRKVLLIKLSQGLIGEENGHLLGSMLVSRIYQSALGRQDSVDRPYFWLYLDEFHHFITPSMERVLSGTRKYNLGLVLAHQEFRQMQTRSQEVASSVLSNCYTRVCFRLGDTDAEKFSNGFSFFDSKALQNLGIGEAIARVERADYDFNLSISPLPKVSSEKASELRSTVARKSREAFAESRAAVEQELQSLRTSRPAISERTKDTEPIDSTKGSDVPKNRTGMTQDRSSVQPDVSSISAPIEKEQVLDKRNQQHRYLQSLVKKMAENKGFHVVIEKTVLGGAGKVDVSLESESVKIACEISVTNEPAYESQNIQKCLAACYDLVVLVSTDKRRLAKTKEIAIENITADELAKVQFLTPEEFHIWLDQIQISDEFAEGKVKGFKVKVKMKPVDEDENKVRRNAISEIVFGAMKRLRNKPDDK